MPLDGSSFHLIGDTHAGTSPQRRLDLVLDDWRRNGAALFAPTIAHLQVGDNIDNATSQNATFATFKNGFSLPFYNAMGNHDGASSGQTNAQWAAQWGYPAENYIIDFTAIRLISVAGANGLGTLSTTALDYLAAALAGTTKPCFLMTHYPPYNSVGDTAEIEYTSLMSEFFCKTVANPTNSSDILAVIAAHLNFKAWLCGHTHSRLYAPNLVMMMTAGLVNFAVINTSSTYYQGDATTHYGGGVRDACHTLFATWYDTGRIDVRFRDHGAGQWVAPNGSLVQSITGL